ncbi:MAG: LPS-assembly protein LptD [Desulfuromonadales bacterium]|nr:LPS-assembly protein LptD [Desulfuromonadales bacterium]MBN2792289.1 LPS-assembly protein LptD [Desulfuromonadales bacterium]
MLRNFFSLVILVLCPSLLMAADWNRVGERDIPVQLEADQLDYDRERGIYTATGDVRLIQGDVEVRGQVLQWSQQTGQLDAQGDVRLISPDEELSGSRASYNLQTGTGTVEQGRIFLRDENLHVQGESIEKRGDNEYHIKQGTFTTCDGDVPSWKFGASEMDVTLGGYARARNMVFYLKNIPSLYFPYMIYPAKSERESGLLIPRVGYSDKRGFQYSGAYYQVLGINQDATLFVDYLTEMGFGKGIEYRYVFGRDNAGEARAYHIDVDQVDGVSVDEERYALEWQHSGVLPWQVRMSVDAEYVNDDDYFEDFGEVAEDYNKDKVQSILSLSKNWGKANLVGLLKYTKDLEVDDPTTLQLLPRVSFDITRQRFRGSSFYYAMENEYTHFWRREGLTGERLMLRPVLSASLQLWDVFAIAPEIAYRERLYWGLSDDGDPQDEGLPELSVKINTRLQKIYAPGIGSLNKLRHSLEPEVKYIFVPEEDQAHLPYFDSDDRIAEANRLEYALVQRLTARFDSEAEEPLYRELLYLRLSQSYDLTGEAQGQRFGALRAEATLLPFSWVALKSDTTFAVDSGDWSKLSAEVDIGDPNGNMLSGDYRYDQAEDIEYAAVDLSVAFLKPVYLHYQQRYDFTEEEQLEQVIRVEYRQQCWSAELSYREHEDDRSVMLTFTMKGIGSVGGVGGNLGGI